MGIVDVVFFENHFELVIDESEMQKFMKRVHTKPEGDVSTSFY